MKDKLTTKEIHTVKEEPSTNVEERQATKEVEKL